MQDIQTKLANVKELIVEKISHNYLLRNIDSPFIDEDKILILISFLEQFDLPKEKLDNYIVTTMLIQIALDTHEHVTNSEADSSSQKKRQLTVLAGDYYSGLYYKLLADMDDVQMIRKLAEGTKIVNELKISVYQKEPDDYETLFSDIARIESSLIEKVISHFQTDSWSPLIQKMLLLKRLLREKQKFTEQGISVVLEAIAKIRFSDRIPALNELSAEDKAELLDICDRYIDKGIRQLREGKDELPFLNVLMKKRIDYVCNQSSTQIANTFAEEG